MKRGLLERVRRRHYSVFERTGVFCFGLLLGAHVVLSDSWDWGPVWQFARTMTLYTPGFLVGAFVGALFGRPHAFKSSWHGMLLGLFAGALFPFGVKYLEERRTFPILVTTFKLTYPLAVGLVTAFLRLRRPANLVRLHDAISEMGLPRELSMLARKVAWRTRLWTSEQLAVARELAGRFSNGLACGREPDELRAELGEVDRAVRELRREKIRRRPFVWHLWHRAAQVALAGMVIGACSYAYLFVRFSFADSTFVFEPSTTLIVEGAGDDEWAWPHYREGLAWLDVPENDLDERLQAWGHRPSWNTLTELLVRNQDAFDRFRHAAGRPRLGHVSGGPEAGVEIDFEDLEPRLDIIVRLLFADFHRAVAAGDERTAAANVDALLGLGRQCRSLPGLLFFRYFGFYFDTAFHADLSAVVLEKPTFFPDDRLAEWARVIRSGTETSTDFSRRLRYGLKKWLAGVYSRDGREQKRLPPGGVRKVLGYELMRKHRRRDWAEWTWRDELELRLRAPLVSAVVLDRSEMIERGDRLLRELERYLETPLWKRGPSPLKVWLRLVDGSALRKARLLPLVSFVWMYHGWLHGASITAQRADATRVAIALARFHARKGKWPRTLGELVPSLLPEVPLDRFDGRPIRYRASPSGPMLFSVGSDGVDNGGSSPSFVPLQELDMLHHPLSHDDPGDWVLLPPGTMIW